jgi:hypothetical protein
VRFRVDVSLGIHQQTADVDTSILSTQGKRGPVPVVTAKGEDFVNRAQGSGSSVLVCIIFSVDISFCINQQTADVKISIRNGQV